MTSAVNYEKFINNLVTFSEAPITNQHFNRPVFNSDLLVNINSIEYIAGVALSLMYLYSLSWYSYPYVLNYENEEYCLNPSYNLNKISNIQDDFIIL